MHPPADEQTDLPYIDEHRTTVDAPRAVVWAALRRYVDSSLVGAASGPLAWLLGTEPPGGFAVTRDVPNERIDLAGRHRFSRYLLVFAVTDGEEGATVLHARSYGAFPGLTGRTYRALVIGTRGHVVAVGHMLRTVRRLSLRAG